VLQSRESQIVRRIGERRIRRALNHASDTREFVIGPGVLSRLPPLCAAHFPGRKILLVADANTFKAAGERTFQILAAAGIPLVEPLIFPGRPMLSPDYVHVERLRDRLRKTDAAAAAVGSGTINDLLKRASFEAGRGYLIVATAASMDGYSSFGAALLLNGFKKTLECPAPRVIVADVSVLRGAPPHMSAAGYADLLGKITAGADWKTADALSVEPIDPLSWRLSQPRLRRWVGRPEGVPRGDEAVSRDVFEGLTMTGFAMQALRSSRPASGTEHLFSHIWEMQHLEYRGIPVSHGFKVALGTLAAAALMEVLFADELGASDVERACSIWPDSADREREVRDALEGTPIVEQAVDTCLAKHSGVETLRRRLLKASRMWALLRRRVQRQLLPFDQLRDMLQAAGCPVRPEHIGLDRERLEGTFRLAQMIRPRYTVLDLAYETGRLRECTDHIFSSKRYFP